MESKHKHGDTYYNIYREPAGSWLVCAKCGNEDIRPAHKNGWELGWTYNTCPDCGAN